MKKVKIKPTWKKSITVYESLDQFLLKWYTSQAYSSEGCPYQSQIAYLFREDQDSKTV